MNKKSEIFPLGVSWEQHADKQQYLFRRIESLKTKNVEYLQDLRESYRSTDKLISENIKLKDEINELLLRNEKLREICTSLEVQIDDINTIVKNEMGYQIDSDEFSKAFDRLQEKGGFPKDEK